jgi:hypothetical protein
MDWNKDQFGKGVRGYGEVNKRRGKEKHLVVVIKL